MGDVQVVAGERRKGSLLQVWRCLCAEARSTIFGVRAAQSSLLRKSHW